MKLMREAEQKTLLPKGESMGSPTLKAVETVADEKGVDLSDAQATAAALTVYNGNMALWGRSTVRCRIAVTRLTR
jgi:hypothetical protein